MALCRQPAACSRTQGRVQGEARPHKERCPCLKGPLSSASWVRVATSRTKGRTRPPTAHGTDHKDHLTVKFLDSVATVGGHRPRDMFRTDLVRTPGLATPRGRAGPCFRSRTGLCWGRPGTPPRAHFPAASAGRRTHFIFFLYNNSFVTSLVIGTVHLYVK